IDASDLSSGAASILSRQTDLQDTLLQGLADELKPAEAAILSDAGPLSDLVDQFYFDPLNQPWADVSEAVLNADQSFADAVTSGSELDLLTAGLQLAGVDLFQVIPAALDTIPVHLIAPDFF